MRFALSFLRAILLLFPAGAAFAECGTAPPTGAVNWTAKWCDEFNGPPHSTIDPANWAFDTGNTGFGNHEIQTYCAPSSTAGPCDPAHPNAYIDGAGNLAIQVRVAGSGVPGASFSSARLKTEGLKTFQAGRIEARIELPSHAGLWPAFCLLGAQPGVRWPMIGESDIMENWPAAVFRGPGANGSRSTVHTRLTGGVGMGRAFTFSADQRVDNAFHIYGEIWSANMIQFYVDDPSTPFFVITADDLPSGDVWPFSSFNNPFFIILDMAVGGTLGGAPDADTGSQPPMLVDYVRQYVPSLIFAPRFAPTSPVFIKAGAETENSSSITIIQTPGTGRVALSCTTTAPKATCVVTTGDRLNNHTVDFSATSRASAVVTVKTTEATDLRSGTPPGRYAITVNAYTISSSDASMPSTSTTIPLSIN